MLFRPLIVAQTQVASASFMLNHTGQHEGCTTNMDKRAGWSTDTAKRVGCWMGTTGNRSTVSSVDMDMCMGIVGSDVLAWATNLMSFNKSQVIRLRQPVIVWEESVRSPYQVLVIYNDYFTQQQSNSNSVSRTGSKTTSHHRNDNITIKLVAKLRRIGQ